MGNFAIRWLCSFLLGGLVFLGAQQQSSWTAKELMEPQKLVSELNTGHGSETTVLFVGFPVLYRGAHVPGAVLAGPDSKPEGLLALKKAVGHLPRSSNLVIYCGCCPFDKCPNVRPAYNALREMGFSHVRVLDLPTNFHTDWVIKGYPVVRGE